MSTPRQLPRHQRVAAYAVIRRFSAAGEEVLLSRMAEWITPQELWTLPGGGLDHGEDPRAAVVREVHEETGLDASVSDTARVYSAHMPGVRREGRMVDAHALRIVYEGWVPADSPAPRVVEVDGSTVDAAWHPVEAVLAGEVPVVPMVTEALADHPPVRHQRLAAYALVRRVSTGSTDEEGSASGEEVLLTRISRRGFHTGSWTLPGGGVDHGETPAAALEREVAEETGLACQVGALLDVHDVHFSGTAPSGRLEDFHGVHLIFEATVEPGAEPRVNEIDGTTDAAAFVPLAQIEDGTVEVLDVVRHAVAHSRS
ncbi:NUDIX domain-containing protein [Nocardioides campestrisoli]|uniref:NUDIX domain-containing protein n=1 Tax=Nocardioides campestrisoli TaxID=2736757 RepID=UPI0015E67C07|nr:NUDIX domain-containing protein [Nocardioides campestrisoli]